MSSTSNKYHTSKKICIGHLSIYLSHSLINWIIYRTSHKQCLFLLKDKKNCGYNLYLAVVTCTYIFSHQIHLSIMKTFLQTAVLFLIFTQGTSIEAQTWTPKKIEFPVPSQGWKVRPNDDKVAWTFGYSIAAATNGWGFTDSENSCQITTDGGETWQTKVFRNDGGGEGYILDAIGVDASVGFVVYYDYNNGTILYRTTDGGNTWQSNKGGVDYFLNWVYFSDKNNGISFGDPGDNNFFQISSTKDGGATWSQNDSTFINTANEEEYGNAAGFAFKNNNIWAVTNFGRILHSPDKGANWQIINGAKFEAGVWGIAADDKLNLYQIWNLEGKFEIYKLENGNSQWVNISPANNEGEIIGFSAVPGTNTLIFNSPTNFEDLSTFKTWLSNDGGTSWKVVSEGEGQKFGFIEFSNPKTGYSCEIPESFEKPSKNVFKYSGTPLSGLLSHQKLEAKVDVFPNPASDLLKIKIDSEKSNDYWILINDMSGMLMSKQIISNQSKIETTIQIGQLPVGSYLITIASNDGAIARQFIKI